MARTIYRDQVERFYELERLEYSRVDIASLCAMSTGGISIWRRNPPKPEDYQPRPEVAIGLPPMRPPRNPPANAKPCTNRATPPPVAAQAEKLPGEAVCQGEARETPGRQASTLGSSPPDPRPKHTPTPGFVLTEKMPPGGKAAAAKTGALRPVTTGQLDRAVAKELAKQRAELVKEIKAQTFDPSVTWQTEVDHVAFDPIRALVQLAHVQDCPHNTILGILRTLTALRKERAKIAWDGVKIDDIPAEQRMRLAGLLAEYLELAELPEPLQDNPALREVYELTGVELTKAEQAEAFMLRWESALEGMRVDAQTLVDDPTAVERLVSQAPPRIAAEFRVRPSTGAGARNL